MSFILLRPCLFSSHLGHSFPSLIFIAPYHELLYFSFHYLVSPLSHNSFFSLFHESLFFLLFLLLLVLLQLLRSSFFIFFIFLFVATLTFRFLRRSSVFLPSSISILYCLLFCHPDMFLQFFYIFLFSLFIPLFSFIQLPFAFYFSILFFQIEFSLFHLFSLLFPLSIFSPTKPIISTSFILNFSSLFPL